jgi:hypothetical protein
MVSDIAKVEKSLAGCWRLPPGPDYDSCVTLLPNKSLEWIETPTSAQRTMRTIITGEKMIGTWAIRERRPTPAIDRVRNMLRDSSASLPDSSLQIVPDALKKFAYYDPKTGETKKSSSKTSSSPRSQLAKVSHRPARWWLVLKVTNFPQSLVSPTIMGTKLDVVDWVHNLKEIFTDHGNAVRAYSNKGKMLRLRLSNGKIETWERVSWFFGTEETIDEELLFDDDRP